MLPKIYALESLTPLVWFLLLLFCLLFVCMCECVCISVCFYFKPRAWHRQPLIHA